MSRYLTAHSLRSTVACVARVQVRRTPGCLFIVLGMAVIIGALAGGRGLAWAMVKKTPENSLIASLITAVVGLLAALFVFVAYRITHVETKEVCPHCGADADPSFQVCQVCGNEK